VNRGLRWLASVLVVALVAGGGYWAYRSGGTDHHDAVRTPAPGPSDINEDTPQLRALKAKAHIEPCTPGSASGALPAVTLPCLGGGRPVDLSTLKGPMLISFWFAGCGPCRKEMPALEAFDRAHGDRVPVLGVDYQDLYPASAIAMMRRHGATYPSLADPGGDLAETKTFAKIPGMPMLFFVDAQGHIAFAHPGGVTSESQVVDLVRQHLGVDL
jgi:thiol-disulfide isomerase/thioredoxin